MRVAVIDGQGAGLGKAIVKKLKKDIHPYIHITALGTSSLAMDNMVKSGADIGLYGEDNICDYLSNEDIDCLIGPIGIICTGGINGEITSKISNIIFQIECTKYLLPLQKHGIYIPGTRNLQIKEIINEIVEDIKSHI
ncbi:DUF3842 family protein [uncultured Clostridium sp.]|uniref:DUF3842 family protein n=1 Tax=uncultured Clostridium sp. TaxID=59620 RepID=UPI0028E25B4A|nr:DUF3842 family protein [uncultured Clostridium sp.]